MGETGAADAPWAGEAATGEKISEKSRTKAKMRWFIIPPLQLL